MDSNNLVPPADDSIPTPSPKDVARQLRKPTGNFADAIAEKMDYVNEPLYDLTLESMKLGIEDSILEIGFGSGRFFQKLFSKVRQLKINGIDYSPEMLNMAKNHNQDFIDSGNLSLELGCSDDLPFSDDTFDKVFCNMVIYFWDAPGRHLQEVYRVLKPGARFYTGMRTRESMLKFPFTQYGFRLYDHQKWCEILAQHGFTKVEIYKQVDDRLVHQNPKIQLESVCIVAEKHR